MIGVVAAIAVITVSGCGPASRSFADDAGGIRVGVRYSAQVARRSSPQRGLELVGRDFVNIKKMKIDVVLIDDLQSDDLDPVLELAAEHEIKLVVPDAAVVNRVRGIATVANTTARLPKSPVIAGYYLGHVVDDATFARARREATRIQSTRPGAKTFVHMDASMITRARVKAFDHVIAHIPGDQSGGERASSGGALQTLRFRRDGRDDDATVRSWLRTFHRGLAQGQSAGLMIDGFRTLPGEESGLVHQGAPLSPERITMVQRIATRAKRWGNVLADLAPATVQPLEESLANVEVAMLAAGARRCILITNPSTNDFVRGEVSLPNELNGAPVVRAVGVPPESATVLGDVIRARSDRLVIPVELAPGDAALHELF
ncbi:MAG: hypothetical protein DHS20C16_13890 [Phycisphaerae bacterium]|nr:MAG: hypothetical protein DHS20C16_13890 [Phycisphaerae bacterium]